jgi:hypothetical protein
MPNNSARYPPPRATIVLTSKFIGILLSMRPAGDKDYYEAHKERAIPVSSAFVDPIYAK